MQSLAGAFKSIVLNHMSHFLRRQDSSFTCVKIYLMLCSFFSSRSTIAPSLLTLICFLSFLLFPTIHLATPSFSHLVSSPLYPYPLSVQPSTDVGLPDKFLLTGGPHLTPSCAGHGLQEQLLVINHPSWRSSGTPSVSRETKT